MKVFEAEHGWLVRLERGEEIHESLLGLAREKNIRGASVQGIGAIEDAELGCFDLERREYARRPLPEVTELLTLTGNISLLEGEPFLHAHVVLMQSDFTVAGGHLFRARVAVTGEFSITLADLNMVRIPDPGIGLALLECGRS